MNNLSIVKTWKRVGVLIMGFDAHDNLTNFCARPGDLTVFDMFNPSRALGKLIAKGTDLCPFHFALTKN